jgi:dihydrofolate reductase
LPKVVFSRTLDHVEGNARLADRSLGEEVAALLESTDRNVQVGGADLAAQAIALGLIDEFRLLRSPVIVGGGTRLLPPVAKHIPLDLVETRAFNAGVVYQRYRRASNG